MLEIVPAGTSYVPSPTAGTRAVLGAPVAATASHALMLATASRERIEAVCAREGWPCGVVDTGLFKVVSVWLEGTQLLELTTPELLPAYIATFGAQGLPHLDAQLRAVEKHLATLAGAQH